MLTESASGFRKKRDAVIGEACLRKEHERGDVGRKQGGPIFAEINRSLVSERTIADQGRGQGWLFRMSPQGELLGQAKLGEGPIYHAGGLDFDGRHLWVPVAEYRPGGASCGTITSALATAGCPLASRVV